MFLQDFPTIVKDDDVLIGLVNAKDRVWRLGRQALSPTFSPFKMKAVRFDAEFMMFF